MSDELTVLTWARANNHDEPVASFWSALCDKLGLPCTASAGKVLSTLRRSGGNSLINPFRGEGVSYAELAHDVACKLNGVFEERPFGDPDTPGSERYVLRKMEVADDDLDKLCAAVRDRGQSEANSGQVGRVVTKGLVEAAGIQIARQAALRAGEAAGKAAADRIAAEAAKKAATKAARAAAEAAARKAAEEVAKQVARQVVVRILAAINVLLVAWTVVDLAGPAYRKTIPAVTYVALLRKLYEAAHEAR